MKIIVKKQTALVVNRAGNEKAGLDLQILAPGMVRGDFKVPDEEIDKEIPLESNSAAGEGQADYNRWVNECMTENQKYKMIALAGQKEGDIVTVLLKYLVE